MVSAVSTTSFANKKPKLFGSLVLAKDTDQGTIQLNATNASAMQTTRNRIGNNGNVLITFASVLTPADSVLIIIVASATFSAGINSSKAYVLKRGATTIDTFSLQAADTNSTNADLRVFVDASPTAGTNTYTLEENDPNTFGGITANLFFIKGTDTHATKSNNILSG